MSHTVKVFAPASVSNVSVGFDMLGFAINNFGDDVLVRKGSKKGLVLKAIHKNKTIPRDIYTNTASYSAIKLLEHLGLEDEPLEMELFKNMPIGTGLGSSAASAVAGVFAVNEYLGKPLSKRELLRFATMSEELIDGSFHADNTAPSLLGGFIFIRDNHTLDISKLPMPEALRTVIIQPDIPVFTRESRAVLRSSIELKEHISQAGNLGGFIIGMYRSDFDLISRSLKDVIIEKQRYHFIPSFYTLQEEALNLGALGCSISGAGPSVYCLCNNSLVAENIKNKWSQIYSDLGIDCNCFVSDINTEGASLY